ncbi:hypothetical protein FCM35_KLT13787 [Carex littledalei]|uniref:Uncharacterized protein n=1 Tax=Carex littledalei TaxID=544730 RepID=A0A833QFK8_9POAL|nr:hypothetical protein FCM35_KLT13787 [Carex littledalei]
MTDGIIAKFNKPCCCVLKIDASITIARKWHVQRICKKVFDDYSESDAGKVYLKVDSLHVAILMVYNSVNKQLLNPHKEPPSRKTVEDKVEEYRRINKEIDLEEFQRLIMEWIKKDLNVVLVNRAVLAFLAAPALAMATKRATTEVPHVGKAVQKVPTPVLFSLFSVGLVLLQDLRVG